MNSSATSQVIGYPSGESTIGSSTIEAILTKGYPHRLRVLAGAAWFVASSLGGAGLLTYFSYVTPYPSLVFLPFLLAAWILIAFMGRALIARVARFVDAKRLPVKLERQGTSDVYVLIGTVVLGGAIAMTAMQGTGPRSSGNGSIMVPQ